MVTVTTRAALRAELTRARADAAVLGGGRVVLVPTFDDGSDADVALMELARRLGDIVVRNVDAPRRWNALHAPDVDLLFAPGIDEVGPREPRVVVMPSFGNDRGESAPGRERVARALTTALTLFHLVQPDVVVLGRDHAGRAALICAMVDDLEMPIEVVVAPMGSGLAGHVHRLDDPPLPTSNAPLS